MTTRTCLALATRGRSFKILLIAAAINWSVAARDLASLVRDFRAQPSPSRRAAMERYSAAHPKDQSGALARLALGIASVEQSDYPRAVHNLKAVESQIPKLEDYALFYRASAELQSQDEAGIPSELDGFRNLPLASPLAAKAIVLRAKVLVDLKHPQDAVRILLENYAALTQPDGDFAVAGAYQAASDLANAAVYYQRVYFEHPDTDAASKAADALAGLRASMGAAYPPAPTRLMFERGARWLAAHDYSRARQEFQSLASQLSGPDHDLALVRLGVTDFLDGRAPAAFHYFQSLDLGPGEADAERYYYLAECQRALNANDDRDESVARLSRLYPKSPWRLKALVSLANHYLVENQPDKYEPLYKTAYESFPDDALAGYCHWKVAWTEYIHRRADAAEKLREQVEHYPADPRSAPALYFLGRLGEKEEDYASARAYYNRIVELYPNYYYTVLARERLADTKLVAAQPSAKTVAYLNGIPFPERKAAPPGEPSPATRLRLDRARLLNAAGLDDLAEAELRFGAHNDGQPSLLAMALARNADKPYIGLRYMKSFSPDYLATPLNQMPREFWELLFPIPYKTDLVRNARIQNLDPYMVAALIRQESEFNPGAISHKSAYGLTQIVPSTGRQLARHDGVRRFRTSMLLQPSTNLKLGERYLRSMLDQWGGKWEETLASYNAGKNHVTEWLSWGTFSEPAEFVESIPFTETREYVQAVLRNASIYRRLYGPDAAALPSTHGHSPSRQARKAGSAAKPGRSREVS